MFPNISYITLTISMHTSGELRNHATKWIAMSTSTFVVISFPDFVGVLRNIYYENSPTTSLGMIATSVLLVKFCTDFQYEIYPPESSPGNHPQDTNETTFCGLPYSDSQLLYFFSCFALKTYQIM